MSVTYSKIDETVCDAYAELGAVCLRGIFADWVELLREGVERNHDQPGSYFSENVVDGDAGRFWDDYCNWQRIPEFHRFVTESNAAQLAARGFGSLCCGPGLQVGLLSSAAQCPYGLGCRATPPGRCSARHRRGRRSL